MIIFTGLGASLPPLEAELGSIWGAEMASKWSSKATQNQDKKQDAKNISPRAAWAFFARFQRAVVLQNRAPAGEKHTFLQNHIFYIKLR